MTHEQFCYFLEGVVIARRDPPSPEQWKIIQERLFETLHPACLNSPKNTEPSFERFPDKKRTVEDYSRTVQLTHEDVFGPSSDSKRLDECEQGEVKKPMPLTLSEMIKESGATSDNTKPYSTRYVPPFTPQEPFKGQGY